MLTLYESNFKNNAKFSLPTLRMTFNLARPHAANSILCSIISGSRAVAGSARVISYFAWR
jgi:hypothetical protein